MEILGQEVTDSAVLAYMDFNPQEALRDPRIERRASAIATRYLYSPHRDCLCQGLPRGFVPAGRIYPVGIIVREDQANAIALEASEGLQRDDVSAQEEITPLEITQRVLGSYAAHGAVEIEVLRGLPAAQFQRLRVNDLFFGPDTGKPLSADKVREGVAGARAKFASASPDVRARVEGIAATVLGAVDLVEVNVRRQLDTTHGRIDKARNGDTRFNDHYDSRDLAGFKFLGEEPQTEAYRKKQTVAPAPAPVIAPTLQVDWEAFGRGMGAVLGNAMGNAGDQIAEKVAAAVADVVGGPSPAPEVKPTEPAKPAGGRKAPQPQA